MTNIDFDETGQEGSRGHWKNALKCKVSNHINSSRGYKLKYKQIDDQL